MQKGQYYSVFKLLQAAVFASVFLLLAWSALEWLKERSGGTDVATVATDVMKSAYNARGADQSFVRSAWLKEQFFTSEALRLRAGLPDGVSIRIFCDDNYCIYPVACVPANGCESVTLEDGDKVNVCASCKDVGAGECRLYIGESVCWPWP